jgi:hypothetical protein
MPVVSVVAGLVQAISSLLLMNQLKLGAHLLNDEAQLIS